MGKETHQKCEKANSWLEKQIPIFYPFPIFLFDHASLIRFLIK